MMQPRGVVAVFVAILYTSAAQLPAALPAAAPAPPAAPAAVVAPPAVAAPAVGAAAPGVPAAAPPQPAKAPTLQQRLNAAQTTTTTHTAWDSAISLSLSSGNWKSSGFIGSTLLSSSGGSSGTSSNSLNSDVSNSGDAKSLGSDRSGSSGLFLRIWMWFIIALLFSCCAIGVGGCCVAFMMKKQGKKNNRNRRRPQADYDEYADYNRDIEMPSQQQTLLPEPPAYEPNQPFEPQQDPPPVMEPPALAPAMDQAPLANSYYTQYPGASNYMQPTGVTSFQMQQPASVMMQPASFQQPAPGYVV